jgi:hypothetical protein
LTKDFWLMFLSRRCKTVMIRPMQDISDESLASDVRLQSNMRV